MNIWQIQEAVESSGIEEWGAGYFSIDRKGNVVCTPTNDPNGVISLPEVIEKAKQEGMYSPLIIRFPQIIKQQLTRLHSAFNQAIKEFHFEGTFSGVFPFKVNQRREFIDAVVTCGKDLNWGLEVGSKTEFMAALSYQLSANALMVCNGFKDREFIDMAFIARALGKNIILVIEGPEELQLIIKKIQSENIPFEQCPGIGIRVRLYSKGSGKWENSSGDTSKFGLTTVELMRALELIEEAQIQPCVTMLHFHIGSQITAIKRFKNALREAAQVYSKVYKMGFGPIHLNIGGGVGVDYDGSQTTGQSSANYSLQEFANDAVYVIGDVCKHENVPCPNIVTESGRVIAAFHSVVITDIREVQSEEDLPSLLEEEFDYQKMSSDVHKDIKELKYLFDNMNSKNHLEFYHDAIEHHENLFTLFNLGYVNLKERAVGEELFNKVCLKALHFSSYEKRPSEEFINLQRLKVSKYLANFSIFQSIPDSWSIEQLFPVLPLSRHDEKPLLKATIVDITCDSDGCIDRFIDRQNNDKNIIELHRPNGAPYYIGFFLVGAYQESLANEHNLFGAINEVEVALNPDMSWNITKTTPGDPIKELLISRNFNLSEMIEKYEVQARARMKEGQLTASRAKEILGQLEFYLSELPYLKED